MPVTAQKMNSAHGFLVLAATRKYVIAANNDHNGLTVIRQIKRCRFHQIKTGLSEHLTMG